MRSFLGSLSRSCVTLTRAVRLETSILGTQCVEIVVRPVEGIQFEPYQCEVFTGIFESIGMLFTNVYADVVHTECIHEGGEVCRYLVRWASPDSARWKRSRNVFLLIGGGIGLASPLFVGSMGVTVILGCGVLGHFLLTYGYMKRRQIELKNMVRDQGGHAGSVFESDNIRNRHTLVLKSISQEANRHRDEKAVVRHAISVMARLLDYSRIAYFHLEGEDLQLLEQWGYNAEQEAVLQQLPSERWRGAELARVIAGQDCLAIGGEHGMREAGFFGVEIPKDGTIGSAMAIPVLVDGGVCGGMVGISLKGRRAMTQEDLGLLMGVGAQVGLSFGNLMKNRELEENELHYRRQLQHSVEDERRRIAFDLHDHVAQDLGSLVIQARNLQERNRDGAPSQPEALGHFVAILKGTIRSVRNIAYELQPPTLGPFGLIHALRDYASDFETKTGISVDFGAAGLEEIPLDFDTKINIYRIVQESLANTNKHARAKKVVIRIVHSHPHVIVRVRDDGCGFDPKVETGTQSDGPHMGLRNIADRAWILKGAFRLNSSPGNGCEITVEIPVSGPTPPVAEAG